MIRDNDIDLEKQEGGTVYTWDDEDRYYRDVILQLKENKMRIYIYNKKIVDRIENEFPDLIIKKRDFYWEVINNDSNFYI